MTKQSPTYPPKKLVPFARRGENFTAMDARSSLAEPPVDFGGGSWALKGELGHGASGRVCLGQVGHGASVEAMVVDDWLLNH